MEATELARRLAGAGKPIDQTRVRKMLRHVESVEHYEATLAALSEEDRATVHELAGVAIRQRFSR